MACWEKTTIEAPMLGESKIGLTIALAGVSPAATTAPSAVIRLLPTNGVLLRPVGDGEVWPPYTANEAVPYPNVVVFEPEELRRGVPYDTFTFNLVNTRGESTTGVVELNVRCAPGWWENPIHHPEAEPRTLF